MNSLDYEKSEDSEEYKILTMLTQIAASCARMAAVLERQEQRQLANAPKEVAPERDLDSKYGDEELRFTPKNCEPCKGRRMSQLTPETLDKLADMFDYFAQKNEGQRLDNGKLKSDYDRRSAARARGWAKRLRSGWKPQQTADEYDPGEPGLSDTNGGAW